MRSFRVDEHLPALVKSVCASPGRVKVAAVFGVLNIVGMLNILKRNDGRSLLSI